MTMEVQSIIRAWLQGERAKDLTAEQHRLIGLISAGIATEEQIEQAGEEYALALKSNENLLRWQNGVCAPIGKAAIEGPPVIPWVMSREDTDRGGDVVRQKGWVTKDYKANNVVIFAHGRDPQTGTEPIANGENLKIGTSKGKPALLSDIRFAVEESEHAARRYRLANAGFIKAGSVGFRPLKTTIPQGDDERAKLGVGRFGVLYEKSELLEFSLVAVPMHQGALQSSLDRALCDGLIETGDAEIAEALADPTEKEWEKLMRKHARSFVDMGRLVGEGSGEGANYLHADTCSTCGQILMDTSWHLVSLSAADTSNVIPYTFQPALEAKSPDWMSAEMEVAIKELAESQHAQAKTLDKLVQAITDLSTCLGGMRGATAEPIPDAKAEEAETDIPDLIKHLESARAHLIASLDRG